MLSPFLTLLVGCVVGRAAAGHDPFMPDVQSDPNVIFGPVIQAHVWKGRPDNVRNGWGYQVYTRMDGIVSSFIPRVHRTATAAARARRELIQLDRVYNETYNAGRCTIHDCPSDKTLLATIQKVWG